MLLNAILLQRCVLSDIFHLTLMPDHIDMRLSIGFCAMDFLKFSFSFAQSRFKQPDFFC